MRHSEFKQFPPVINKVFWIWIWIWKSSPKVAEDQEEARGWRSIWVQCSSDLEFHWFGDFFFSNKKVNGCDNKTLLQCSEIGTNWIYSCTVNMMKVCVCVGGGAPTEQRQQMETVRWNNGLQQHTFIFSLPALFPHFIKLSFSKNIHVAHRTPQVLWIC